ncbi:hypothetical protein FGB62_335g06 [Gracilaria domingensis]|nr:hypothetical protein FGB62_335g06 [Gracilaria domingensis]
MFHSPRGEQQREGGGDARRTWGAVAAVRVELADHGGHGGHGGHGRHGARRCRCGVGGSCRLGGSAERAPHKTLLRIARARARELVDRRRHRRCAVGSAIDSLRA